MPLKNKKAGNFTEWYLELVESAELMDYSPIQGCMTIRPRAYAVWEAYQALLNAKMNADAVSNAYFPMFIPESFLTKEAAHFEGFAPEVAWVTQGGNEELAEKLAVRPTSETIMYHHFAKWIHSWRDLPLKVNQWCNVIRWDTKTLKPFLRTREFLWQEGHTAHATEKDADEMTLRALHWYRDLCENYLALPVLMGRKSESEKFPGALYTTTIEALMPDGKALQCGTSHQLGQNFAKMFEVKFKDQNEGQTYAWQTSWGTSTRLLGALFMTHSDDKGLVLPPRIAPLHVVIVPIAKEQADRDMVMGAAKRVRDALSEAKLSVHVDDRSERSPGYKFNEWELKGIPVRIEIGMRDLAEQAVTVVRRDSGAKESLPESQLALKVPAMLEDIQKSLLDKATAFLKANLRPASNLTDLTKTLEDGKGFVFSPWCGDPRCEEAIKEETGATIRLIPFEDAPNGGCVMCGKASQRTAFFARSY
ncbi:proline--tRNA ligase [Candidatus Micrarchaeota archaeon]|nr:proline--tRNA ligase [Candidatus Micrarchaeota archaeon]